MPQDGSDVVSPVFVDVEASGIAAGCYPIEIGHAFARLGGDGAVELVVASHLIRPAEAWAARAEAWDAAAEPVHGLTRAVLASAGLPVGAVCDRLDADLGSRIVASDTGGDGWDAGWIAGLYAAAGRQRGGWALSDSTSGALVAERFRAVGLLPRIARPAIAAWAPAATHAAAEDALRFAWEWGMAHLLAQSGIAGLEPRALAEAMQDLPRLVPEDRGPLIGAASLGRFRRR